LIYGAVQVQQIKEGLKVLTDNDSISYDIWDQTEPFLIIIPIVVALGSVLLVLVAWKLYDEFAWSIYKHISADLRMKRRYLTYQVCGDIISGLCEMEADAFADLHRLAQIRFLLLPRFYRPVPGYRHQQTRH
jgi:hypothetical protein